MKPTIPRFMEICELVMGDEESPNLDGVTKEELLLFGKVASFGAAITQKELCFWKKLCYILGGTIVLSCLIDLLKLAEVI
jgi:hypothetical protein